MVVDPSSSEEEIPDEFESPQVRQPVGSQQPRVILLSFPKALEEKDGTCRIDGHTVGTSVGYLWYKILKCGCFFCFFRIIDNPIAPQAFCVHTIWLWLWVKIPFVPL